MKIKEGYMLRKVAGNYIVVPLGAEALDFNGLITTNETGAFLWQKLTDGATEQDLLVALLDEYDVDENTARTDILVFIKKLVDAELLTDE